MTTALIPAYRRLEGIAWPDADDAMPAPMRLWEVREIELNAPSPRQVPALVFEEWAVHRMIDREGFADGWAITTHANGGRFTWGARVFASAYAAMEMAEHLASIYKDFASFTGGRRDLPPDVRAEAKAAFERAERDGKILHDLVSVR